MFVFVVCLLWSAFGVALSEYYAPIEGHHLNYQNVYAPEYHNYVPKDYKFDYAVSDPHTGDHKSQWEVKENGVVRGSYSLLEADGTTRVVDYIADDNGFRAVVKKLGNSLVAHAPQPATLVPLPQAYNLGYHGAYSGEVANYGLEHTVAAPIQPAYHHVEALPHIEPVAHIQSIPHIEPVQPIVYQKPIEHYNVENLVAPIAYHENVAPIYHAAPIPISKPAASVEYHGFSDNSHDDGSAYSNYDNGYHHQNAVPVHYTSPSYYHTPQHGGASSYQSQQSHHYDGQGYGGY